MTSDRSSFAFITFEGEIRDGADVICVQDLGYVRLPGGEMISQDDDDTDTLVRIVRAQLGIRLNRNRVGEIIAERVETIRRHGSGKQGKVHTYTVRIYRVSIPVEAYINRRNGTLGMRIELRPKETIVRSRDFLRSQVRMLVHASALPKDTELSDQWRE